MRLGTGLLDRCRCWRLPFNGEIVLRQCLPRDHHGIRTGGFKVIRRAD
jgi:hypothetical protein